MHCPDCESCLIDYASHELPEQERAEVAGHLATCSGCALEYCRLQADLEGIVEAHAEVPSARAYRKLRRAVAEEYGASWRSRARGFFVRPVPMYGAVLAGLVPIAVWAALAFGLVAERTPPRTPSPAAPDATLINYDATSLSPAHRWVL